MQYRIREQGELIPSKLYWIKNYPKTWNKMSLKYLLKYSVGSTPSTSKDEYFYGNNIWVSISDIKNKFIDNAKQRLSDKAISDYRMKVVPKGSLLYTFKLSVGEVSFNEVDLYTNEAIASFLKNENVNLNFWYYALSKYLVFYANENIYGAKLLNQELIKNARLLVPSITEQQKIAKFLDEKSKTFDDLISKKEELISKLEDAKQSLISEVVSGKLKVIKKENKLQTIKRQKEELQASGIDWLGDIPIEWVKSRFDYETRIKARLGWKGLKAEEYVDEGYAFLATPNIKHKDIDFENVNHITKERYDESPEIMLELGDVLLTKDGSTTGIVNVVRTLPKQTTVNSSIAVIRPKKDIDSIYLYYFISSSYLQDTINLMLGGMGVPHLFQGDLNKFKLLLPLIEEQKQISKYLDKKIKTFDNTIEKTKQSIIKLKQAKESLISEAVTGKIEIL